jgi:hypothetical protein
MLFEFTYATNTPPVPTPNAITIAAMEEVEEMIKKGSGNGYNSMEELLADLNR